MFLLADTDGGRRRLHNERSDFAGDILRQCLREMIKEANRKRIASISGKLVNRQRFKLSPFCWLVTAADFVDYIVKNAQFVITCNYKVVEHGKTNPIKR